jgi:hypothetical protein
MNRYHTAARFAFALLAVLALAIPAAAGQQVPFKGKLEGTVTRAPVPDEPTVLFVLVEGEGKGTHLGNFSFAVPHYVDTVTRTAGGEYHFVAANGDTVTAEFSGAAIPTATPGVLLIRETATITGGTGRFAGATGNFVVERLYDAAAGTTVGSYEGTISSTGANKK